MASQAESKGKHSATHDEDSSKKAAHKSAADTKSDSANNQELDSLLSKLDEDLTTLDADTALSLVDEWYDSLHKAKEPEIKEIAASLKDLKQLLKSGKATGHEIGEVLIEISEQIAHVASDASKDLKTPLQKLGKLLKGAGTTLGKEEDREHIERIDSLVEEIEKDVTKIDTSVALSAIDEWYTLLHKSEDESIKEISNGLKELKQILKRSNAKGADIGELLTRIGEQTQESAKEAGRGLKGPIQRLGKMLSKAGKPLD